jgi:hypothetical protein
MFSFDYSEGNSLLFKIIEVFVGNANFDKLFKFSSLDIFNFGPFVLNIFSDLSALLKVVESILLFDCFVSRNLGSDFYRVVLQSILFLLLDLSLLLFDLFLLLDLEQVILSFNSSLFSQRCLLF